MKTWRRLRWVCGGLLSILTGLAAFGDKLQAIRNSSVLMYVYVLLDVFRTEIAAALLLVILWNPIRGWVDGAATPGRGFLARPLVSIALLVLLIPFGAYQATQYYKGKLLLLREYPRLVLHRADGALLEGDARRADIHLAACAAVFTTSPCVPQRASLKRHVEAAQKLRNVYRELKGPVRVSARLLEDIYLLDRDERAYEEGRQSAVERLAALKGAYRKGLDLLASGSEAAAAELAEFNKKYPGFGAATVLAEELKGRRGTPVSDAAQEPLPPYLATLRRLGAEEFLERTVRIVPPRPLAEVRQKEQTSGTQVGVLDKGRTVARWFWQDLTLPLRWIRDIVRGTSSEPD